MSLTTKCASRPGLFFPAVARSLEADDGGREERFFDDAELERGGMLNGNGEFIHGSTDTAKGMQPGSVGNTRQVYEILSSVHENRRLGDHLILSGAYPQAAKAYHRAITKGGDAVLTLEEGNVAGAHLHARMAAALLSDDLFLEASPYASEALQLAERDPYVRYVHAFMLCADGGEGEAMDTLDELALEPALMPWVNVARAEIEPDSVDVSVLRGILADATTKEPMSGALHARLSIACEGTGHYLDALEHARVAAWLQPSLLRRWRRYGAVAMLAQSYTEAAEAFDCARDISPSDPRLDVLIARAHLVGGDIDQAAACVLRGLRKDQSQRDCLAILRQLQQPYPATGATELPLEVDQEAFVEKEPFIYVPPWAD